MFDLRGIKSTLTTLPIRQQPRVDFTHWLPETSHPGLTLRACVCVRVYVCMCMCACVCVIHGPLITVGTKIQKCQTRNKSGRQPQGSALRFTKRAAARVCHPAAKKKKRTRPGYVQIIEMSDSEGEPPLGGFHVDTRAFVFAPTTTTTSVSAVRAPFLLTASVSIVSEE